MLGVGGRDVLESRWVNFLVLNAHVILQALISSALCQWVFESTFPVPAAESQLLLEKFREFVQNTTHQAQLSRTARILAYRLSRTLTPIFSSSAPAMTTATNVSNPNHITLETWKLKMIGRPEKDALQIEH